MAKIIPMFTDTQIPLGQGSTVSFTRDTMSLYGVSSGEYCELTELIEAYDKADVKESLEMSSFDVEIGFEDTFQFMDDKQKDLYTIFDVVTSQVVNSFDEADFNVYLSIDLPMQEKFTQTDNTLITNPSFDKGIFKVDRIWNDVDLVQKDATIYAESAIFNLYDREEFVFSAFSIVELELEEDPLEIKDSYYYSVNLKYYLKASEDLEFDLISEDKFVSLEVSPEVVIPVSDESEGYLKYIHFDYVKYLYDSGTSIEHVSDVEFPMEELFILVDTACVGASLIDEGSHWVKYLIDEDLLLKDEFGALEDIEFSIPAIDYFVSSAYGLFHTAPFDEGIANVPETALDADFRDYGNVSEESVTGLFSDDLFIIQESVVSDIHSIINYPAKDVFAELNMLVPVEYTSIDSGIINLFATEEFNAGFMVGFNIPLWDKTYSIEKKPVIDADLLQKEFPVYVEKDCISIYVDDQFILHEIAIPDLHSFDESVGEDLFKYLEAIFFERVEFIFDASVGLISDEHFTWTDSVVFNLFSNKEQHEAIISRPLIDADLLQTDNWNYSEKAEFVIPVEDYFVSYEVPVLEVRGIDYFDVDFAWDINDLRPDTYREINLFIELFAYEEAQLRMPLDDRFVSEEIVPYIEILSDKNDSGTFEEARPDIASLLKLKELIEFVDSSAVLSTFAVDLGISYEPAFVAMPVWDSLVSDYKLTLEMIITDKHQGVDSSVINLFSDDLFVASYSAEINIATTTEWGFYKSHIILEMIIRDPYLGVDTSGIGLFSSDWFNEQAESIVNVAAIPDFGIGTSKLIQELRIKDPYVGKDRFGLNLYGSDEGVLIESWLMHTKASDFATSVERNTLLELLLQKETIVDFNESVILLLDEYDLAVSEENPIFSFEAAEFGRFNELLYYNSLIKVKDEGFHCYNTIIYDADILQRDLIFWWENGYKPGNYPKRKIEQTKWGREIVPYDLDYPYFEGDSNYGKSITFFGEYQYNYEFEHILENAKEAFREDDPIRINYQWNLITGSKDINYRVHLEPFYLSYNTTVLARRYEIRGDLVIRMGYYASGSSRPTYVTKTIEETKVTHLPGTGIVISGYYTDPVTGETTIIPYHFSPNDSVGSRPTVLRWDREDFDVDVCDVFSSEISERHLDVDDCFFDVYLTFYHFLYDFSDTDWSTGFNDYLDYYLNVDCVLRVPSIEYKTYRPRFILQSTVNDGWYETTDFYPSLSTFKLYINQVCGPATGMDWIPKNKLERFVLDKMEHYQFMNIDARLTGDEAILREDAIISLYSEIVGDVTINLYRKIIETRYISGFDDGTITEYKAKLELIGGDYIYGYEAAIIGLALNLPILVAFTVVVEEPSDLIYINVKDYGSFIEHLLHIRVNGEDSGVYFDDYTLEVIFYEHVSYEEWARITREYLYRDSGVHCYTTSVFDAASLMRDRDVMFWWEPGYMPGHLTYTTSQKRSGNFRINSDFGKPIVPGDVDYPYFKGDPRYGNSVLFGAKKRFAASDWTAKFDGPSQTEDTVTYLEFSGHSPYALFTTNEPIFKVTFDELLYIVDKNENGIRELLPWENPWDASYTSDYDIPWDTQETSFGNYGGLEFSLLVRGPHINVEIPLTITKGRELWINPRERQTWYFVDDVVFNAYDYTQDYDLSRATFTVSLQYKCVWWGSIGSYTVNTFDTHHSYYFNQEFLIKGFHHYAAEEYLQSRRQAIYNDDGWFVANDVLYYEPTTYKIYINNDCNLYTEVERPPINKFDAFVQNLMKTRYFMNVEGTMVGDHGDVDYYTEFNFKFNVNVSSYDWATVLAPIDVSDEGYFCEDLVVYSPTIQDRDLMFWWEKDYPVRVEGATQKEVNPLIGEDIRPGDFDYPYSENTDIVIPAKRIYKTTQWSPIKWRYDFTGSTIPSDIRSRNVFLPLTLITDGVEVHIKGGAIAFKGEARVSLVLYCCSNDHRIPDDVSVITQGNMEGGRTVYLETNILYPKSSKEEGSDYFIAGHDSIVEYVRTFYLQDIKNKYGDYSLNYLGFYVSPIYSSVRERRETSSGSRYYTVYYSKLQVNITGEEERFTDKYLRYREPGIIPNDGRFVARDFYEEFFGFKFFVSLGCGPDDELWPIPYTNDFERWIFNRAKTGNYNEEYGIVGDSSVSIEDGLFHMPLEDFGEVRFDLMSDWKNIVVEDSIEIIVEGHVWLDILGDDTGKSYENPIFFFNSEDPLSHSFNLSILNETILFERGTLELERNIALFTDDKGFLINEDPIFTFNESIVGTVDYDIDILELLLQHEFGDVNFIKSLDLMSNDFSTIFETPVIGQSKIDAGEVDFDVSFLVLIKAKEELLGKGKEFTVIPLEDQFFYSTDSSIYLHKEIEHKGEDKSKLVEFIYVFEDGLARFIPIFGNPQDALYCIYDTGIPLPIGDDTGIGKERRVTDREEVYQDVGYVCFWIQIVNYPFVIDWLAGHFVDYYGTTLEAEYVRYTSCFGVPPGGWPKVKNYPGMEVMPPYEKDPTDPYIAFGPDGYGWVDPTKPHQPEHSKGYIRIPVDDHIIYVLDPTDPPEPYVWAGGCSIMLIKFIEDKELLEAFQVIDAFYFALFDVDGNIVSDVHILTFESYIDENGVIYPGSSYAMTVFMGLEPDTTYYVHETDADGNIITVSHTSEFSGHKYLIPQEGLEVTTVEGKCVDAGVFENIIIDPYSEDEPFNGKPIPVNNDNYEPEVYPEGEGKNAPPGISPFEILIPIDPFDPYPVEPYFDNSHLPPLIPPGGPFVKPFDALPTDAPGFEGKLAYRYEHPRYRDTGVLTVPVDMLAVIWELHYIPAAFILDLTGMKIEWIKGFEFEISSPFQFTDEYFKTEYDEPFKLEDTKFAVETENPFLFGTEDIEIEHYVNEFDMEPCNFELQALFEEFKYDSIDYDGPRLKATPEVYAFVLKYDGQEHELVTAQGRHGTIMYQVNDEETWSEEIPHRTNAGGYIVKWYAKPSLKFYPYGTPENYYVVNCTIEKATATFLLMDDATVVYGEETFIHLYYSGDGEVSISSSNPKIFDCEIVDSWPEPEFDMINTTCYLVRLVGNWSGVASFQAESKPGPNYLPQSYATPCFVTCATMLFEVHNVTSPYTGKPIPSDITVIGPTDYKIYYSDVALTEPDLSYPNEVDFYINAGAYNVYFTIVADNYYAAFGMYILTIEQLPQEVDITVYDSVYDAEAHPLIIGVLGVYGTIYYSLDGINYSIDIPEATLPKYYTIYWYIIGDENHYDEGSSYMPRTIVANIGKLLITETIENQIVDLADEEPLVIEIPTPSDGGFNVTVSDYELVTPSLSGITLTLNTHKEGSVIVYVQQYEGTLYQEHTFSFILTIKDTRIVYEINPVVVDYTGELIDVSGVTVIIPEFGCKVYYAKSPLPNAKPIYNTPEIYKDAGEYNIYVMLAAFGRTTKYDSYKLTINKIPNVLDVTGIDIPYDGKSHKLVEINEGYGPFYYSLDGGVKWTTSMPFATYPVEQTIYYYCKGDLNHLPAGSEEEPFMLVSRITPADVNPIPITITVDVGVPFTKTLLSPSTGEFGTITYSSTDIVDESGTYMDSEALGLLHVLTTAAGEFTMEIPQEASSYYNACVFSIKVISVE